LQGWADDGQKRKLFEETDVLVMPSNTENFGMVVAEALAHRVPVIVSRGTPWRRVEETGCGLWVSNDPHSLADAIVRMSRMPLGEMGERGRRWMMQEFAWPTVANRMVNAYRSLLETKV
jgi:glycosyltransferase involved in cell wall biosynthesis